MGDILLNIFKALKGLFLNENCCIPNEILLKFVPFAFGVIDSIGSDNDLVLIM